MSKARLGASWRCLGTSCGVLEVSWSISGPYLLLLKVKSLKILIFEGFSEVLGDAVGGGCRRGRPDSGPLRVYKVQCIEVKDCKRVSDSCLLYTSDAADE